MRSHGNENLDPELAELMALEEEERASAPGSLGQPGQPGQLDPELQALMDLEEEERRQQG